VSELVAFELRQRSQRELVKLDEPIVGVLPGNTGVMRARHNEVVLQPLCLSADAVPPFPPVLP
jgi:hypothetical protein